MKKAMALFLCASLSLGAVTQASASVDTISVVTSKSSSEITAYVKNNDNKKRAIVTLELQKDGKTSSVKTLKLNENQQLKHKFKLADKGKYRIKYTYNNKSSYTSTYSK